MSKPFPPSPSTRPSDAELAILRILWQRGPCTVRAVHDTLVAAAPDKQTHTGYTTVLKTLQIMHEKRLVTRDDAARAHLYAAAVSQAPTERRLVADFIARVFGGSAQQLVLRALSAQRATPEELQEIRHLLDSLQPHPAEPNIAEQDAAASVTSEQEPQS